MEFDEDELRVMHNLSPRRKSTEARDIDALVAEQLAHYHIDPAGA